MTNLRIMLTMCVLGAAIFAGCGDNAGYEQKPLKISEQHKLFNEERLASFDEGERWCGVWDEKRPMDEYDEWKQSSECDIRLRNGQVCTVVIVEDRAVEKPVCPEGRDSEAADDLYAPDEPDE